MQVCVEKGKGSKGNIHNRMCENENKKVECCIGVEIVIDFELLERVIGLLNKQLLGQLQASTCMKHKRFEEMFGLFLECACVFF